MLVRTRALLFSAVFVPLASGCTLWYLATDPLGGANADETEGGASDGGGLGTSDAADGLPDCGPLDTPDNCGACGRKCDHGADCLEGAGGANPYNCGPTQVDLQANVVPIAIATRGSELYILDTHDNVWACSDACDSQSMLFDAGTGVLPITAGSVAASDNGVFWISDMIHGVEPDGGKLATVFADNSGVETITANGNRVAWTDDNGIRWTTVGNGPGFTYGGANGHFTGADKDNVALVRNGNFLAWSTGHDVARFTQLLSDGDASDVSFDALDASVNMNLAADDQNVFLTWRNGTGGQVDWLPSGDSKFEGPLDTLPGTNKSAAVFGGNGLVYWSPNADTIAYCDPTMPKTCLDGSNTALNLDIGSAKQITGLAATPTAIFFFFKDGAVLYRVAP